MDDALYTMIERSPLWVLLEVVSRREEGKKAQANGLENDCKACAATVPASAFGKRAA